MTGQALAQVLVIGAALAMLFAGAAVSLTAANVIKRLTGAFVALIGAIFCAGVLGASNALLVAATAIGLGYCACGAALLVRVQESYGETEAPELNKADRNDEPRAPRP
ncbi:MAG: hypothetical protein K2X34_07490 [Hyphomonadaceae bacterium]|nr:hypothetical protein [Hyphomonadaceae bacterium]